MDMKPVVYEETLDQLLTRMENAQKHAKRTTGINGKWQTYQPELRKAALESNRNWLYYINHEVYKELGHTYPYTTRLVFDEISKLIPPPRVEGSPVENFLTRVRRESKERQHQKAWDELYNPRSLKRVKRGNIQRIAEGLS